MECILDTENYNQAAFQGSNSVLDHLQGVERAQALEGIRSYLRDLVVAQVSAQKTEIRNDWQNLKEDCQMQKCKLDEQRCQPPFWHHF